MEDTREQLNSFLVQAFHSVLRAEERSLRSQGYGDLSISEIHVIEACLQVATGGRTSATAIARALNITLGSLSTAVGVLEKKGYLTRERDQSDRRRILILPTAKGRRAEAAHRLIHEDMVDRVLSGLDGQEAAVLSRALISVAQFFTDERNMNP